MELEKEVFSGKKISDLIQEVYDKQKDQEEALKEQIERLSSYIEGPGDAIVMIPHIKDLFDTNVKNNDVLLKLLQLFKQNDAKKQQDSGDDLLSEKDIQQLFDEVHSIGVNKDQKKISE
jgi:aromatic ring-opening dioxygenase LigB subunit